MIPQPNLLIQTFIYGTTAFDRFVLGLRTRFLFENHNNLSRARLSSKYSTFQRHLYKGGVVFTNVRTLLLLRRHLLLRTWVRICACLGVLRVSRAQSISAAEILKHTHGRKEATVSATTGRSPWKIERELKARLMTSCRSHGSEQGASCCRDEAAQRHWHRVAALCTPPILVDIISRYCHSPLCGNTFQWSPVIQLSGLYI